MSSSGRRATDKGKKNEQDKSRRAERQERRESNDGLEGAVAAAAVTVKHANKIRTPGVSASPPTNKETSAAGSPIKKHSVSSSTQAKRVRQSVSSERSDDGSQKSDDDEAAVTGAKLSTLVQAASRLKKRSNITTTV